MVELVELPESMVVPRQRPAQLTRLERRYGWFICRHVDSLSPTLSCRPLTEPPASEIPYVHILMNDDPSRAVRRRRWAQWLEYVSSVSVPLHVKVGASGWREDFLLAALSNPNLVTLDVQKWTRSVDFNVLRDAGSHLFALQVRGVPEVDLSVVEGLPALRVLSLEQCRSVPDLAPLSGVDLWELSVQGRIGSYMKIGTPSVACSMPSLAHLNLFNTTTDEPLEARRSWTSGVLESAIFPDWFFGDESWEATLARFPALTATGEHLGHELSRYINAVRSIALATLS